METFGIKIYKEYFNFAAAHFLIFEDGTREELHGHNYQVQMMVEGALDEGQDVFIDFLHIKPIVKAVCDSIDHRTLLPGQSRHLQVNHHGNRIEATYLIDGDQWIFPSRDVIVLPIPNTSAERLAQYLCTKTLDTLQLEYTNATIRRIEFSVEESRGQAAIYRQEFSEPVRLSDISLFEAMAAT